jgi:hypothetical protein
MRQGAVRMMYFPLLNQATAIYNMHALSRNWAVSSLTIGGGFRVTRMDANGAQPQASCVLASRKGETPVRIFTMISTLSDNLKYFFSKHLYQHP